jgi:hypothetical protein
MEEEAKIEFAITVNWHRKDGTPAQPMGPKGLTAGKGMLNG